MRTRTLMIVAVLALGGLVLTVGIQATEPGAFPSAEAQAQPGWQIVRIVYRDRADLQRVAARLDVWEVRPETHVAVARVSPADYDWLLSQGYKVTADSLHAQPAAAPSLYGCYRAVEQLYSDEDALASTFPRLTQIITIGASYEGRPLRVLKLTNQDQAAPDKPHFFLMANLHGREFITPETAMQLVRLLLEGYGRDADATWLLDWHEVHVLVTANPDGHWRNEAAFTYWRKNANPANQNVCPANPDSHYRSYGTDLNRNHGFQWGLDSGSSGEICAEAYRGPAPASEIETTAIQSYVAGLFPDQRGTLVTNAAPLTATGILISLHSYSNLVLWPWGFTDALAPNDAQLAQLGRKLASYNLYTPQPAHGLYLASGTTDDWSYGTLGIASYTFEIGGGEDGFLPPCSRYDALIQPNLAAFLYAARVARAPYQLSAGPDALALTATLASGTFATARLTATITSDQVISAAQAYLDVPPWAGGTPLPMSAAAGVFGQSPQVVGVALPMAGAGYGRHILFVQGQDVSGNWGPVSAAFFDAPAPGYVYLPMVARD